LLVDVQAQSPAAVICTFRVPASAFTAIVSGDTAGVQAGAWFTEKVCPATVMVPVRADPVFAAAMNCTGRLPVPPGADVMLIQPTVDAAVDPHVAPVFTVNPPAPPPDPTCREVGDSV
jgi:hypothetical protein